MFKKNILYGVNNVDWSETLHCFPLIIARWEVRLTWGIIFATEVITAETDSSCKHQWVQWAL